MIPVRWFLAFLVVLTVGLVISGIVEGDWIRLAGAGIFAVLTLLINWRFRR